MSVKAVFAAPKSCQNNLAKLDSRYKSKISASATPRIAGTAFLETTNPKEKSRQTCFGG